VRTTYRSLLSALDVDTNIPIFLIWALFHVYSAGMRDGSTTFQGTPIPYLTQELVRADGSIVRSFDFGDLHSFSGTDVSTYNRNTERLTRYDDAVSNILIASRVVPPIPWLSLASEPRSEPFHQYSNESRRIADPSPMSTPRDPRRA
jgi:hypothetical protein